MNELTPENSTNEARRRLAATFSCSRCGKTGSFRQSFLNEDDAGETMYLCYNCALLRAVQLRFEGYPIIEGNGERFQDDDGVIGRMLRWVEYVLPDDLEQLRRESERACDEASDG